MSKRVLVVDDEQCIADTLAAILRRSNYDALPFYDASSALAACDAEPPALIISDVVMPGMTGIDLAIQVRQQHPECKVLLFSGMATTADLLEQARRQGYDFEILPKPVHPDDLLAKMVA